MYNCPGMLRSLPRMVPAMKRPWLSHAPSLKRVYGSSSGASGVDKYRSAEPFSIIAKPRAAAQANYVRKARYAIRLNQYCIDYARLVRLGAEPAP